jgi:hypothetical protein
MALHQRRRAGAAAGITIGGHPLRAWLRAAGWVALMLLPVAFFSWPFALAVLVLGTGAWLGLIVALKLSLASLDWILVVVERMAEAHPTVVALRAQAAENAVRQAKENERWKEKHPEAHLEWARSKHSENRSWVRTLERLAADGQDEVQSLLDWRREQVAHWEAEVAEWEAYILAAAPADLSPAGRREQERLQRV